MVFSAGSGPAGRTLPLDRFTQRHCPAKFGPLSPLVLRH